MAGMFMTISFLETPEVSGTGNNPFNSFGAGKMMFGISTKIQGISDYDLHIMMISPENYTKLDFAFIIVLIILLSYNSFGCFRF
jgi:hypothetical protein